MSGITSEPFIPFSRTSIGEEEIREVVDTLRSGWLTTGPRTAKFEAEFAAYVGAPHALAVNSCTAALHLALRALGLKSGDEVITTPLTFCATVNTILEVGATPVLADIGGDGNLDPKSVEARITDRTRAVVPVHLGGLACEMEPLWRLAARHGLKVVEDAAHAVGTHYRGFPIGAGLPAEGMRSDAVAYSFYATKNLTTGEGGMVTTHDQGMLEKMRVLSLHGIDKDAWNRYAEKGKWFYEVVDVGYKYNLSDIQSAIGLHQLRKQEEFVRRRTRIAQIYSRAFADIEEVEVPPQATNGRHCWHLYILRLNTHRLTMNRDEFVEELRRRGIGTSVHFIPIPMHPAYKEWAGLPQNHCPRAMALYPRIVSLPLYPSMMEREVERVTDAVREIVRRARRGRARYRGAAAS
ncbi:MAG: DegT/DnrJ/EryC1/StrS family aminotransferase [Acidobacteriales bacterium]|nr:DegT/DnrJ/EryC1/StrS family aminotransferase [Terriglobales bacterium]